MLQWDELFRAFQEQWIHFDAFNDTNDWEAEGTMVDSFEVGSPNPQPLMSISPGQWAALRFSPKS